MRTLLKRPDRCYYCGRKVQWRNLLRHQRTTICITGRPAYPVKK